ncbi:MAG: agmatine deiminase family protein [Candidatus Sumerlaeaceae bacterium]|nr:agmatine deiminase family protein [Candidatus Sumerlaeaceae bacterium]
MLNKLYPPARNGYHMPAEWEPHTATWLAWPHNVHDWPGKFHPIPWVFAEVVKYLSASEEVKIIVRDARHEARVRRILEKADAWRGTIDFFHARTNRCWTRDFLPTFVVNPRDRTIGAVKWQFNAWAKYDDFNEDQQAGMAVANYAASVVLQMSQVPVEDDELLMLPWRAPAVWQPFWYTSRRPVVLEGGAFDVNGSGLLLATDECLLDSVQQRNPGATRSDYEEIFRDYLGVTNVLWLAGGIEGDDTHGHIDDVARFVSDKTIAIVVESDPQASHYVILSENQRRLKQYAADYGLEIVDLPLPAPVFFDRQRLPASYANFYIANKVVLVPTFNDPNDRIALEIISHLFPDRQVIGIHCLDLVLGLGTLHCMTQQQPRI